MTMIALGGIIGAGLFVGSSAVIDTVAVAQLRMRRQLERESPERLKVRMWLYPWLTWASIVAIVAIVASMAFVNDEATRAYLVPSLISLAIVVAVAFGRERLPGRRTSPAAGRRRGTTATA
jgi:L-asparagine transporter-like permease